MAASSNDHVPRPGNDDEESSVEPSQDFKQSQKEQMLFEQLRAGSKDRELVVEALTPRVYNYFRKRESVLDPYPDVSAEDLAQDAMLTVLEAIPRFEMRSEYQFLGWLYMICRTTLTGLLRRRTANKRRHIAECSADDVAVEPTRPDILVLEAEQREILYAAIDQLSPSRRESILLNLGGLTGDAAAKELSIERQKHYKNVSRARQYLKSYLDGEHHQS